MKNKSSGHVYVIESENGKIKIGIATFPQSRLKDIQSIGGFKIKRQYFSEKIQNYSHIEAVLHDDFKLNRCNGEWFNIDFDTVVSHLIALSNSESVQKIKDHRSTTHKFNSTNDNIEWAKWSWNPVTGCLHDCVYCYARDIGIRFSGHFKPEFHPERLNAPSNTRVPEVRKTEPGIKNVFVCSMADLFGDWVDQSWIDQIMDQVRNNQQWNFLFLTKNPKRYIGIDWPKNAWVGTTVDNQDRIESAIDAFEKLNTTDTPPSVTFLSCEPLLSKVSFDGRLDLFDWVIIGGQSRSSKCEASQPEWDWVESLLSQSRMAGCKVYFKPNLSARPKEYPEA